MDIKDPKILGRAERWASEIKEWSTELLTKTKSKADWSFVKEVAGITIADQSTACMRGCGSVECPPRRLQMALEDVENTPKYDDACIKGKLIEQLCDNYENDLGVVVGYVQVLPFPQSIALPWHYVSPCFFGVQHSLKSLSN